MDVASETPLPVPYLADGQGSGTREGMEEEGVRPTTDDVPETKVYELGEDLGPLEATIPRSRSASPVAEVPPQVAPEPVDERQCRICLGGPEEEEELGRLITPCLCRGTIRVRLALLVCWKLLPTSNP